jgi:putative intracellular protease/amidase
MPIRKLLEEAGHTVETASSWEGNCRTTDNRTLAAKYGVADVDPTKFDAIVFGGYRVEELCPGGQAGAATKKLIEAFRDQDKTVAAICTGQKVLVAHHFLDRRPAAHLWEKNRSILPPNTVLWSNDAVVHDKPFITARGPEYAAEFAEAIIEALK